MRLNLTECDSVQIVIWDWVLDEKKNCSNLSLILTTTHSPSNSPIVKLKFIKWLCDLVISVLLFSIPHWIKTKMLHLGKHFAVAFICAKWMAWVRKIAMYLSSSTRSHTQTGTVELMTFATLCGARTHCQLQRWIGKNPVAVANVIVSRFICGSAVGIEQMSAIHHLSHARLFILYISSLAHRIAERSGFREYWH